jgi:hypothetical protein
MSFVGFTNNNIKGEVEEVQECAIVNSRLSCFWKAIDGFEKKGITIYWSYSKLNHMMYDLSQLNNGS